MNILPSFPILVNSIFIYTPQQYQLIIYRPIDLCNSISFTIGIKQKEGDYQIIFFDSRPTTLFHFFYSSMFIQDIIFFYISSLIPPYILSPYSKLIHPAPLLSFPHFSPLPMQPPPQSKTLPHR